MATPAAASETQPEQQVTVSRVTLTPAERSRLIAAAELALTAASLLGIAEHGLQAVLALDLTQHPAQGKPRLSVRPGAGVRGL